MSKPPGNLSADKQALLTLRRLRARVEELERAQSEPIAVVGLGCRFPGGASSPEAYWDLLHRGVDGISEVPADRWDIDRYYDRNPDAPGKMSTRWGGWIAGPDRFDPQFFGIAPREAVSLDPQQRMLLEITWEALEHAGIAPQSLAGTEAGVFIGISTSDYGQFQLRHSALSEPDAYFGTGNAINAAAGRLSYVLGLLGPSLSVDTACSSSLVAVHLACQSLRRGESTLAIAGGVNFILLPELTVNFSRAHMMAADGRCKTFDAAADGYVRGEGCGVVLLKRLSDALANGDRVLAVVRGSAVNQDGRSGGFTAPSELSQQALIRRALAQASVEPAAIDYVEAHGTGTSLGDPIEVQALGAVLGGERSAEDRLWVGSAKTNIGHLEAAAGIAGLIKVVLSFEHEEIPPHLHFSNPNPYIPWDDLPIRVPTSAVPWRRGEQRRIAGVSSFGFTGTNAHVIVEEPPVEPRADESESRDHVLCLSAKNDTALAALATAYADRLNSDGHSLADVCFTSAAGRSHFNERMAIVGTNIREMAGELEAFFSSGERPASVFRGTVPTSAPPDVAFLFTGQDSLHEGMGQQLYAVEPAFRNAFDRCAERLNTLDDTARTQPAVFAFEYALAELWRSWGVKPSFVLGHGIGEYVAACVAGVFSLDDALKLVAARGRLSSGGVSGADVNAPGEIVLSGAELDAFERVAEEVTYHAPAIAIASNLTGEVVAGDLLATPSYWRRHAREAVRFADGLRAVAAQGCRVFVEVGPRPTLIGLGRPELADDGVAWVPSMTRDRDERRQMLDAVAALYVRGVPIDWTRVHGSTRRRVALPTYPFQRERYWVEIGTEPGAISSASTAPAAADRSTTSDWLYDIVWQPHGSPRSGGWLEPALTARQADPWTDELLPAEQLRELAIVKQALEDLSLAFAMQAFERLGWKPRADQSFDEAALARELQIARHHRRLFSRLLGMLGDEGLIAKSGELWTVSREWSPIDPREVCAQVRAAFPQLTEQLAFIERCGLGLADVLTGECNPLELLFPNGSSAQAEHIYRDSPLARSFNTLLARTVADLASRIPAGGKVRVLEIGAGTGGSSSFVLPALPSDRTEYVFTDVSKMFLSRAEPQFGRYPFVRYATLNIENDPASQGFDTGRFDIVIAANVIHATRDLATALTHIKQLLAPGGVVLLLEATEAQRWIELTFGLTEGWFRFTDTELRSSHPLLSRSEWLALLRREGFEDYAAIPGAAIAPEQTLLIARTARPAKDRAVERDWIFLADANGVAAAAAALLRERGERATCLPIMSADEERRGLQRAMAEARGETTIVHLRSLDASGPHDAVAQAASQATLELCRAVSGDRTSSKPRIWLATRGAQPVDASGVAAPGQAPVWGLGRVLGLEQPDVWGGLIDLDPAAGAADQARDLVAIIAHAGDDDQIAVRNRAWFVPRIVRAAPIERRELRLDPQASYLVTGGLGRLGLNVGRWLGDRGARTIALLGRRGLPDRSAWKTPFADQEIERQVIGIRRIEETGARVVILTGDVADSASMRKVLADLDGVAPIKGIVHAATDLSIVPLAGMSDEQLATMLRPKVAGTSVLHELTRDRALDFFVLFSSTTALWGVSGMAHYAAANQFLDAFAHARRQQNLPATVINWGTWDELRVSRSEDRQRIAEAGLNGMSSERALDVLGALISGDATAKTVASIDWTRLKTVYEARRRRPLFDRIELGPSPKTSTSEGPSVSLAAVLEGAPEDRHERILAHVRDEAVRVLRLGSKRPVDPQQGLFEMGMDSLMSLELKSRLETFVGQTLPSTLTFNYPSIAALTTFIESLVPGEAPVRKRAPVGRAPESKTAPKPAERPLRNMSEDALAQLLADRLQKIR